VVADLHLAPALQTVAVAHSTGVVVVVEHILTQVQVVQDTKV
jgi:hypothetical protein